MALTIGTRLGPYEILAPLGAGGMGEVYKARDTRLDRTVAIKVLAPHVLAEPGLRARFEREARTASSLDHPNICVLHDVGREGDVEYIVMQHLEGETLAARLARGPLPVGEALRYATEIASALDRAHRAGILHRDIKPGNVMLVKSAGRDLSAKLLDFGLAKTLVTRAAAAGDAAPATASLPLTGQGTIVGTLLYMSPEQLEGRDVDARSDIFSFGAVLYEMVTGRRAFDGGNQASIIAAVLERDPPSMAAAVPVTPPALDRVVRKCLAKDRDRRWQSAADLCDELSWIAQSSGVQPAPSGVVVAPAKSRTSIAVPVLALLAIALAAWGAWIFLGRKDAPAVTARHLSISLPGGLHLVNGGIAASPDGQAIVFAASAAPPDGTAASESEASSAARRLYLRRANAVEATPIPGTEGARSPFFSPDSQSVAYFTSNALMKVSLRGGQPVRVGGAPPVTRGGVWLPDDSIVVAPTQTSGLVRFSPDGTPGPLTNPDAAQGELAHTWPQMLPGGADILFTIRRGTSGDPNASDIGLLNVASGERRVILKGAAFAQYASTGHLLFLRGGTLSAVPFDLRAKQVSGSPVPLADAVAVDPWIGGAHFAVAPDGTLLVVRGTFPEGRRSAVWVDRDGKAVPALGNSERLPDGVRIAPGGTQAMYSARSAEGDSEVYLADLGRGTSVRLSADPRDDFNSVWTADGGRAVWSAMPAARMPFLVMRSADGTGPTEEVFPDPDAAQFVGSVSRDGILAFTRIRIDAATDIWTVPLNGDRKARPFVATEAWEIGPEFSPDGRWVAYVSNEAGARDVYVVPYPGPGPKRRVSPRGGVSPAWSRDGRELFYLTSEGLVAVNVGPGPAQDFSPPRLLFDTRRYFVDATEDAPRHYDVAPNGQRFLMLASEPAPRTAPPELHVLLNWASALR
jgi:tRNA A-37 threonylcarbamoyl transferase component Bud32